MKPAPSSISGEQIGAFDKLEGVEHLDAVVLVDQEPIGRTFRSNPITYIKAFDLVREIFAEQPLSRQRGYSPGHFSFNVKGGRCEACQGDGVVQVEMVFLADVVIPCEICNGARYKPETLEVTYKGRTSGRCWTSRSTRRSASSSRQTGSDRCSGSSSRSDSATCGWASPRLPCPAARRSGSRSRANSLVRAKSAVTASTSSMNRLRVCPARRCRKLLCVLQRLLEAGHTVIVIEHNMDMILAADWIIDLGPEAGEAGGKVVAMGAPEQVARVPESHTGRYITDALHARRALSV